MNLLCLFVFIVFSRRFRISSKRGYRVKETRRKVKHIALGLVSARKR